MADYLPCDVDNITVKTSTIKSIIDFIENGDCDNALDYLRTIIDFKYRAEVRKRKAELLFLVDSSVTSAEHSKWQCIYNAYIEKSLF